MMQLMYFEDGTGTEMIGSKEEEFFDRIYKRAHTFNGYDYVGSAEGPAHDHVAKVRSAWVEGGLVDWPLDDLRAALFIEARYVHGSGYPPSKRLFIYLRDLDRVISSKVHIPSDEVAEYRKRDLHAEGIWPKPGPATRFGLVVVNEYGWVMLREPTNHFDGYVWTFAKAAPGAKERPIDTALRSARDEYGHLFDLAIIGHLPKAFGGTGGGSVNCFYLGRVVGKEVPSECGKGTASVRWGIGKQAADLVGMTTNKEGRARDLEILEMATQVFDRVSVPHSA